jgi:hypothetical protein
MMVHAAEGSAAGLTRAEAAPPVEGADPQPVAAAMNATVTTPDQPRERCCLMPPLIAQAAYPNKSLWF